MVTDVAFCVTQVLVLYVLFHAIYCEQDFNFDDCLILNNAMHIVLSASCFMLNTYVKFQVMLMLFIVSYVLLFMQIFVNLDLFLVYSLLVSASIVCHWPR